jgi:intracellular multiplication protein IcmW
MPNLDLKSSHEYWKDYEDPMIYRVIAFMESVESFTLDGDDTIETMMHKIGMAFESIEKFELGKENEFIVMTTYLKISRVLRILQTIDTIEPGSASRLLMYAEEKGAEENVDSFTRLFLRRNIVFERLRLLTRVFDPERFTTLLNALENEQ